MSCWLRQPGIDIRRRGIVFWQACPGLPQHLHAAAWVVQGEPQAPGSVPHPLLSFKYSTTHYNIQSLPRPLTKQYTRFVKPSPVSGKESSKGSLRAQSNLSSSQVLAGEERRDVVSDMVVPAFSLLLSVLESKRWLC